VVLEQLVEQRDRVRVVDLVDPMLALPAGTRLAHRIRCEVMIEPTGLSR